MSKNIRAAIHHYLKGHYGYTPHDTKLVDELIKVVYIINAAMKGTPEDGKSLRIDLERTPCLVSTF